MSGPQWCCWRKQCLEWSGKPLSRGCLMLLGRQKTWHKVYNIRLMMTGWVTSLPVKWKTRLECLEFTRNTKVGAMDTWERPDTRGSLALEPHRPQQPVWIATIITIININIIIMTIIAILICIWFLKPDSRYRNIKPSICFLSKHLDHQPLFLLVTIAKPVQCCVCFFCPLLYHKSSADGERDREVSPFKWGICVAHVFVTFLVIV